MGRRRNRQRSVNTDVWLSREVAGALEELADFFGPRRTRAARYFITCCFEHERVGKLERCAWNRTNRYLVDQPKGEPLVRFPLRIFQKLLEAVDEKAREMNMSRSALLRRILTASVDERIEIRWPSLVKTLTARGLPRARWVWEK